MEEGNMSQNSESFNPLDPMGAWKSMRDANMDAWSKAMLQLVNSDAYAQSTATFLDSWLSTSAPFRKALEASLTHALAAANLPSRNDVISLAERLTNIEMRLDDLEVNLEEIRRAVTKTPAPRKAVKEDRP
jgi:hypothetical protein